MLVVLCYYQDGSAGPEIKFFLPGVAQGAQVASYLTEKVSIGMLVSIYLIESLDKQPEIVQEGGG